MAARLGSKRKASGSASKMKGGARGGRNPRPPVAETEGDQVTASKKVVKKSDFLEFADDLRRLQNERASGNSAIGDLVKKAKNIGINPEVLKLVCKLKALPDAVANDFVADFNSYCEWYGIATQRELFERNETRPQSSGDSDPLTGGAAEGASVH